MQNNNKIKLMLTFFKYILQNIDRNFYFYSNFLNVKLTLNFLIINKMMNLKNFEVWFATGSQHLYGPATLQKVAEHSQEIAKFFNDSKSIPVSIVYKPVLKTPDEILQLCIEANTAQNCIGIITWCHTFSPSKMWINGLRILSKPLLHLHTQYNRDIPWSEIDMDFMNLNQSAHGDREHGFIMSRMRINRKVVVGHWQEADVQERKLPALATTCAKLQ